MKRNSIYILSIMFLVSYTYNILSEEVKGKIDDPSVLGSNYCPKMTPYTLTNTSSNKLSGGGSANIKQGIISNFMYFDKQQRPLMVQGLTINPGSYIYIPLDATTAKFDYLNNTYSIIIDNTKSSNIFPMNGFTQYILNNVSCCHIAAKNIIFYDKEKKALNKPINLDGPISENTETPIPDGAVKVSIDGQMIDLIPNSSCKVDRDNGKSGKWTLSNS
ncbi:MAG: hypothetical protein JO129_04795 [Candidatus Dependentiae bacterium]|nr:hypothetical protein [Candidatus Dependentiae bacterium]